LSKLLFALISAIAHSQKQGCESAKGEKEKETKVMSAVQPWRKESS
jgi:hypothetical protein